MLLPFVRELFTDVELLPGFARVASHLKEGTGRLRVSGLLPAAKALLLVLLRRSSERPLILVVNDNRAVEDFVHAGYPTDAAAILLVEVDGLPGGVDTDTDTVAAIARANRARTIRIAADETERAALWKGRKSAFGAIARIKPNYYLHDTVIPRTRLVEVLERVYAIAQKYDLLVMNVFPKAQPGALFSDAANYRFRVRPVTISSGGR